MGNKYDQLQQLVIEAIHGKPWEGMYEDFTVEESKNITISLSMVLAALHDKGNITKLEVFKNTALITFIGNSKSSLWKLLNEDKTEGTHLDQTPETIDSLIKLLS